MYGIPILTVVNTDENKFKISLTLTLDQSLQIIARGTSIDETKLDTVVALEVRSVIRGSSDSAVLIESDSWGGKYEIKRIGRKPMIVFTQDESYEKFFELSTLQFKVLSKIIEIACAGIE